MAENTSQVAPRERQSMTRRDPSPYDPFGMLQRFADEIDNVFDGFGMGRGWLSPRSNRNWLRGSFGTGLEAWAPQVEVHQQNNELVVRADLPGLKKEDITIDVTDDAITIAGERRQEQENERGGVYRSERSYGSFRRTIPLPDGAMTDQAKATCMDGVLEIRMPAPPEHVTRGRRLEIQEGKEAK